MEMLDLKKTAFSASAAVWSDVGVWSVLFYFYFTRDPGDQVFQSFGGVEENFDFRLGMHQEWRHGMIEIHGNYGITQGDLKHCLNMLVKVNCLGSRHVITRESRFYASRNPLGTIPKHQLNRCGFVGPRTSQRRKHVGMLRLGNLRSHPPQKQWIFFPPTQPCLRLPRMSCCPCVVSCYSMFLDQFSANAFVDLVLHSSPLWPAMNNADLVMQKCQTTANSLKLGRMNTVSIEKRMRNHDIICFNSHL